MNDYLKASIHEEINKGMVLKSIIPKPLKFQELQPLAERCERIIDDNISILRKLLSLIDEDDDNLRFGLRQYRNCTRGIREVEYFGISALYYPSDDLRYLNRLVFRIHQAINLPINPPFVACISTDYYNYFCGTDVIFVPMGETKLMLHLPDIFHEIGHAVFYKMRNNLELSKMKRTFEVISSEIAEYYQNLKTEKSRSLGPENIPPLIDYTHYKWQQGWLEEVLCDLFALYTVGPAYAKAHIHLTTKMSDNVYRFDTNFPESHPSDHARLQIMLLGLNELGLKKEADEITNKWNSMIYVKEAMPQPEYQYAYPEKLLKSIAIEFLNGMEEVGFNIYDKEKVMKDDNSIIQLLDVGWSMFWEKPNEYRAWEEKYSVILKEVVSS